MRVLMTGATGFLGVALCKELLYNGHSVTAVVRPDSVRKDRLPAGVTVTELPLDALAELSGEYDVCYHFAWNGASGEARNHFETQMSNIGYTAELIRAAKRCGCRKFIGAGSQAEYGVIKGRCDETAPTNPFMMYGAAKLSAYQMGKLVAAQEKISFVWPRIYSVYGVGENEGTLMSYLVDCLKHNRPAELSAGENMWDFMYITDCARALRMIGEHAETEGILNISAGKPDYLKNFILRARAVINPDCELRFGAKPSDPARTFWLEPDVRKLEKLGFACEVEFEEGVRRKADEI